MTDPWFNDPGQLTRDVRCDWCGDVAVYLYRFRFAGEGWRQYRACSRHARVARIKAQSRRQDGMKPLKLETVTTFAF
jgi:hypothetical protein